MIGKFYLLSNPNLFRIAVVLIERIDVHVGTTGGVLCNSPPNVKLSNAHVTRRYGLLACQRGIMWDYCPKAFQLQFTLQSKQI